MTELYSENNPFATDEQLADLVQAMNSLCYARFGVVERNEPYFFEYPDISITFTPATIGSGRLYQMDFYRRPIIMLNTPDEVAQWLTLDLLTLGLAPNTTDVSSNLSPLEPVIYGRANNLLPLRREQSYHAEVYNGPRYETNWSVAYRLAAEREEDEEEVAGASAYGPALRFSQAEAIKWKDFIDRQGRQ